MIAKPDPERGSVVCAFVVLRDGVAGDAAKAREIQDYVKGQLAPYKYPRDVRFMPRAPAQHQRQAAALQAARGHRGRAQRAEHSEVEHGAEDEQAVPAPPSTGGPPVKIAIAGGGPGGLYLAALMKQLDPRTRSRSGSATPRTTPSGSASCSPTRPSAASRAPTPSFARPDGAPLRPLDRHRHRTYGGARQFTVGGQGFAAMSRKDLLRILQERVARARRQTSATARRRRTSSSCAPRHDLVVAADGVNSPARARARRRVRPRPRPAAATSTSGSAPTCVFEAFQFFVKQTPWGTMQIHGYPYSATGSTFIVEMHEDVWRAAGFDATEHDGLPARGQSTSTRSPGSARSSPTSSRATRSSPTTPSG